MPNRLISTNFADKSTPIRTHWSSRQLAEPTYTDSLRRILISTCEASICCRWRKSWASTPETRRSKKSGVHDGIEIDLVTHDARNFIGLMLKKNGYVLEQLLSPLVVHTTPEHEELKSLAKDCVTRHHAHH